MNDEQRRFADLRAKWEERAAQKGDSPFGVLYRNLPESLNRHVHDFHLGLVRQRLLPGVPQGGRLLDLGCGYGRLGQRIRRERDDISLVGMDFSHNFCRLHREGLKAWTVCGDLGHLPFAPGQFDAITIVTALMYIPRPRRGAAFDGVVQLLKPGGRALFVDPGQEYLDLMARLRPASARETTGGSGFTLEEYAALSERPGIIRHAWGANPWFSLSLPGLYLLSRLGLSGGWLHPFLHKRDHNAPGARRLTLHRWMLVERQG